MSGFLFFSFLVVFQILFFQPVFLMCFSLWDIRMLQNKELGNLTHRFRMKLGVWETFFGDFLWLRLSLFFRFFFKNHFWCVFRLSTQILSSSRDMHQLRSFFYLLFHFFFWEVVNPDFCSKNWGLSNFIVSKLWLKVTAKTVVFISGI